MKDDHAAPDLKSIAYHAMEKYGFDPRFPDNVMREADAVKKRVFSEDPGNIMDFRNLLWSSIDNYDSMDLDQLEFCEHGENGQIRVLVAIADVDLEVPKASYTDRHAAHNGTSVYTGIETFPMLPDVLSKGRTSLLPGNDHIAVIVEYWVLPAGTTRSGGIFRGIVSNKAKLVYEETGEWLEGTGPVPEIIRDLPGLESQIRLQNETAQRLKKHRIEQGALDLDTIEAHAIVENGTVRDLVIQRQNMARCIIEEFMVAANGIMVAFLGNASVPMIQRIVRVPKNWDGIVTTAATYHERLPRQPDVMALSLFLKKQKENDPERFPDLSLTVVKLLGPGEYVPLEPGTVPVGHFALAVTDYTHGTAPNRRYVDLIIQRLLKSVINKVTCPYGLQELEDLSAWLTDREKASKKVERFMRKAAAAVLLKDRTGEIFTGVVTGVTGHGTYVRLLSLPVEGRITSGEQGLIVGQEVRVRLVKTDPYNGYIDFAHVR